MNIFEDANRLIEFSVQMSVIVGLIGAIAAWLKRSINRGMVSKEEFDLKMDNTDQTKGPPGIAQDMIKLADEAKIYTDGKIESHAKVNDETFKVYKETQTDKEEKDTKWLGELQLKFEGFIQDVAGNKKAIEMLEKIFDKIK